jgi:dCMP deaminase
MRAFAASQKKVELVRKSHAVADEAGNAHEKQSQDKDICLDHHRQLMREEAGYEANASTKRSDFLSWDDYFMWVAFLTAKRCKLTTDNPTIHQPYVPHPRYCLTYDEAKDPSTQVGACLVLNRRIVGLGYNGFPLGCSDDCLPWARHNAAGSLHTKYPYVVHAEKNTILNSIFSDVRGASLYVDLFPCNECAKFIVQAGIREVVYLDDKYHDSDSCKASRILFGMAGVKLRQHTPTRVSLLLRLGP